MRKRGAWLTYPKFDGSSDWRNESRLDEQRNWPLDFHLRAYRAGFHSLCAPYGRSDYVTITSNCSVPPVGANGAGVPGPGDPRGYRRRLPHHLSVGTRCNTRACRGSWCKASTSRTARECRGVTRPPIVNPSGRPKHDMPYRASPRSAKNCSTARRVGMPAWPPRLVAFRAAVAEARTTRSGRSRPSAKAAA